MSNTKLIFSSLSFTLLLFITNTGSAYIPVRGNVHAVLGSYFFQTNYGGEQHMTAPNRDGIAVLVWGDVSDHGSLEMSMFHMSKTYYRRDREMLIIEKVPTVHVSIGYRYWWKPDVSLSLGLFTSYPLEDTEKIFSNFPPAEEITTTARENSQTGLDMAVDKEVWADGRYAVTLGARYSWALTKLHDEFSDQYGVMLGLRYFIQGRDRPED